MTPEKIFIKYYECPSDCQYNVGTMIPNQKGTKQGFVCCCICMKAFVAGYNKSIELKTKRNE